MLILAPALAIVAVELYNLWMGDDRHAKDPAYWARLVGQSVSDGRPLLTIDPPPPRILPPPTRVVFGGPTDTSTAFPTGPSNFVFTLLTLLVFATVATAAWSVVRRFVPRRAGVPNSITALLAFPVRVPLAMVVYAGAVLVGIGLKHGNGPDGVSSVYRPSAPLCTSVSGAYIRVPVLPVALVSLYFFTSFALKRLITRENGRRVLAILKAVRGLAQRTSTGFNDLVCVVAITAKAAFSCVCRYVTGALLVLVDFVLFLLQHITCNPLAMDWEQMVLIPLATVLIIHCTAALAALIAHCVTIPLNFVNYVFAPLHEHFAKDGLDVFRIDTHASELTLDRIQRLILSRLTVLAAPAENRFKATGFPWDVLAFFLLLI